MGINVTGLGIANGIAFKSKVTGDRVVLPPELKRKIVCAVSAYGKTKNDADRDVLVDKTGNGNDFLLSGFSHNLYGGYSEYTVDYNNWSTNIENVPIVERTSTKVTGYNNSTREQFIIYRDINTSKDPLPSCKVRVTNLVNTIRYYYIDKDNPSVRTVFTISKEGTYWLPMSRNDLFNGELGNSNAIIGFSADANGGGATIEQLPEYIGGLRYNRNTDNFIASKNTVKQMIGDSDKITVVSMFTILGPNISQPSVIHVTLNNIRTDNNVLAIRNRADLASIGQTCIIGYTCSNLKSNGSTNPKSIEVILGDKNRYASQGGTFKDTDRLFPIGFNDGTTTIEKFNCVYYWTLIFNDEVSTVDIQQAIAYFNFDRPGKVVRPDILLDIKKQGINNDNHADFADKLKDFSGNGWDFQTFNLDWNKASGIGKYPVDFKDYNYLPARATVTVNKESFIVTANANSSNFLEINTKNKSMPSYKIRVEGLNTLVNGVLGFRINTISSTSSFKRIDKDGDYEIPEIPQTEEAAYAGFCINGGTNTNINIKITLLPEEGTENSLCLDGVKDYASLLNCLPIYKDYTFASLRKWAEIKSNIGGISSKSKIDGGSFIIEQSLRSSEDINTYTFGLVNLINIPNLNILDKSYARQTKYLYDYKRAISIGNYSDFNSMWIGAVRANDSRFSNIAISNLLVFPYSLSEFLLERQLKHFKLDSQYPTKDYIYWNPKLDITGTTGSIGYYKLGEAVKVGDVINKGDIIQLRVYLTGKHPEIETIYWNDTALTPTLDSTGSYYYVALTVTDTWNQNIRFTVDNYIYWEEVDMSYPYVMILENENGDTFANPGDKMKIGSKFSLVEIVELLPSSIVGIMGMSYNGQRLQYDVEYEVESTMKFTNVLTWNIPKPKFMFNAELFPNDFIKHVGYIPDLSGQGHHLKIYNSDYSKMSGKDGYIFDMSKLTYSATRVSYTENSIVMKRENSSSARWMLSFGKPTKNFDIFVMWNNEDNVNYNISYTLGGNTINHSIPVDRLAWMTIPIDVGVEYDSIKLTAPNGNNYYGNVTIKQKAYYEGAFCFDGVKDYAYVNGSYGIRELFMKFNNLKSQDGIIYDQRTGNYSDFAIYEANVSLDGTKCPAYKARNPNGQTYIDGVLNTELLASELIGITTNIREVDYFTSDVETITTDKPHFAKSAFTGHYSQIAFYKAVGFESEVTDQSKIDLVNDWLGIEGRYIPRPYCYWDCYGKSNNDIPIERIKFTDSKWFIQNYAGIPIGPDDGNYPGVNGDTTITDYYVQVNDTTILDAPLQLEYSIPANTKFVQKFRVFADTLAANAKLEVYIGNQSPKEYSFGETFIIDYNNTSTSIVTFVIKITYVSGSVTVNTLLDLNNNRSVILDQTEIYPELSNLHLEVKNVDYEGMSGYGGYPVVFGYDKTWFNIRRKDDGNWNYGLSSTAFTIYKAVDTAAFLYIFVYDSSSNTVTSKVIPEFRINITGLKANQVVRYKYVNEDKHTVTTAEFNTNGEHICPMSYAYELPETPPTLNIWIGFLIFTNGDVNSNIRIEVLPEYLNAISLDGVKDYIVNDNLLAVNKFSVVVKYKALKENTYPIIYKGAYKANGGAFIDSYNTEGGANLRRFTCYGQDNNIIDQPSELVYYTKYRYVNKSLIEGTNTDYAGITIGRRSTDYRHMLFYKMFFYNKTINIFALKMLANLVNTYDGIIPLDHYLFEENKPS